MSCDLLCTCGHSVQWQRGVCGVKGVWYTMQKWRVHSRAGAFHCTPYHTTPHIYTHTQRCCARSRSDSGEEFDTIEDLSHTHTHTHAHSGKDLALPPTGDELGVYGALELTEEAGDGVSDDAHVSQVRQVSVYGVFVWCLVLCDVRYLRVDSVVCL